MKYILLFMGTMLLSSCWKFNSGYLPPQPQQKVWGSKPVYAAKSAAEKISYTDQKHPNIQPGNIYAFGKFIFQVDVGRGIHVIDNAVPSQADRIGFITVNGCEQISIKGNYLYTNSFADLITLDISNPARVNEVSRVRNAFPELMYNYPLVQPQESGYYNCPQQLDSVVIGWVKDSIFTSCYKN
ncbi:MAG: hypothetical protein V4717_03915 [Bacteroidota bacterium]